MIFFFFKKKAGKEASEYSDKENDLQRSLAALDLQLEEFDIGKKKEAMGEEAWMREEMLEDEGASHSIRKNKG